MFFFHLWTSLGNSEQRDTSGCIQATLSSKNYQCSYFLNNNMRQQHRIRLCGKFQKCYQSSCVVLTRFVVIFFTTTTFVFPMPEEQECTTHKYTSKYFFTCVKDHWKVLGFWGNWGSTQPDTNVSIGYFYFRSPLDSSMWLRRRSMFGPRDNNKQVSDGYTSAYSMHNP